jgi:hypothetical protein
MPSIQDLYEIQLALSYVAPTLKGVGYTVLLTTPFLAYALTEKFRKNIPPIDKNTSIDELYKNN